MKYTEKGAEGVKIAYIGGGSRGWAWNLMSDLAKCEDMSGDVYLYDIDFEAAQHNEIIGNKYNGLADTKSVWNYHAAKTARCNNLGINAHFFTHKLNHIIHLSYVAVDNA